MPSSLRKRRTFVLNSTVIVFVEYSFSHVPLPYNKFHVSLKGCSQIIEIGTFINESTYFDYLRTSFKANVKLVVRKRNV